MIIKSAKYLISSVEEKGCPAPDRPEFAFIGRSNVGKSSLINMLTNQHKLAKTSSTPGKTQHINHFDVNHAWYLVDLPGYGYAKVSKSSRVAWEKMIRTYLLERKNLLCLFVLIDSRHKAQTIDLEFIDQLGAWNIPFALIFTKTDKSKIREVSAHVKDFKHQLLNHWEELPAIFQTSAAKGTGKKPILDFIGDFINEYEENKKQEKLSAQ